MRVAITGSNGLIGSALRRALEARGDEVVKVVRRSAGQGEIEWAPGVGRMDADAFGKLDAVVNLAGESIGGRWTAAKKREIRDSRVKGTSLLATTLAQLNDPPSVLINASAIGYYGDRGNEILTEASAAGSGYLADVCTAWEAATEPAETTGVRVARLRFGQVLDPAGGSLQRLLLPFKLGVGGRIGAGTQYWSWIGLGDAARAILHVLDGELRGPINVTTPHPVTNREFTDVLGDALGRPTVLAVPAAALRLVLGTDMTQEVLLASQRVVPEALEESGFRFEHPTLRSLLSEVL
jgi:uncharacterized protein (TIGR01777 family)